MLAHDRRKKAGMGFVMLARGERPAWSGRRTLAPVGQAQANAASVVAPGAARSF
jgi:hypothetical protein